MPDLTEVSVRELGSCADGLSVTEQHPDCTVEMMLEEDGIRVEWEDIGEGICGDYNPEDPDDIPLLRFSVSILLDGQWETVEDASYCTQMPVDTPVPILERALQFLFQEYKSALSDYPYHSVKRLGERLSWIGPDDFQTPACRENDE